MHIACAGLAPNAREADWLKLAGDSDKLQRGMARLYRLFQNAPVLGSLINPRAGGGDLLEAGFQELRPLLTKALAQEGRDDVAHEMAVTAQGITKAAEILGGQFTLVATNVPYLGRGKQSDMLKDWCERVHPEAKADLATCFVERCLDFCSANGSTALVTPQGWLFQGSYKHLRAMLLRQARWNTVARLGPRAFETISGEVVNVILIGFTRAAPHQEHQVFAIDASSARVPGDKSEMLRAEAPAGPVFIGQAEQLSNPDASVSFAPGGIKTYLVKWAGCYQGLTTADDGRWRRHFWEVPRVGDSWRFLQAPSQERGLYSGREDLVSRLLIDTDDHTGVIRGREAWGKRGIAIDRVGSLARAVYDGQLFHSLVPVVVPYNERDFNTVAAFCLSDEFVAAARAANQGLSIDNGYLGKVPFDLVHWQGVAAERYPNGLPKPFSSDATQWLFNGNPKGADQPLQVAVARLVGYGWPRQTGSSLPDCAALGPDGLEKLADDDGIVCIPPVRGEEPAAERLRKLLAVAYGNDWKGGKELELIRASGSDAGDLEQWLRNDFFEQHCDLFHHRPFIWHIWDGRKRDGFHALVNYHRLAAGESGRRTLENLTHSYLGDWITRQKDGLKRGEEGAEERLAAALALKERLEAILAGEGAPAQGTGVDIFVRWKPLSQQAIGWEPDVNDGVRMNIRPFLASDLPNGKKGAGVLRVKPNIRWEKDRGKEPHRAKEDYPWFWNGSGFTGERVNDVHLTIEGKRRAREG